jgi:cell division protein FtsL
MTKRGRVSRRSTVALILLGFVLVATGVIARRTYGIDQARALRDLDRRRQALEAERVKLDGEIRDASSLRRLAPIAQQRLEMHVPSSDQVIMLPRPRPRPAQAAPGSPGDTTTRR